MIFGSLRLRLLVAGAAFIFAALGLAAVGLTILFERHVERWLDGELIASQDQLIAGIDTSPSETVAVTKAPSDPRFAIPLSGLYWQITVEPSGPVLRSRSLWDHQIAQPAQKDVDDDVRHYRVPGPEGSPLYLLQRRVELPARLGRKSALVAVALDAREVRAASWRFASALAPFLILVGALLAAAAWAQVTVGLRPLGAMRTRLLAIASGDRQRLGSGFPEEVQPLAREIDALLDARDQQIERARARAADLAHGLKTPLQVLAGEIERLHRQGDNEVADTIEEVSTIMESHVDRQLTRARLGSPNMRACADVAMTVEKLVGVMQKTPAGKDLVWTITVPAGLNVRIDADDLAEALGNILENAARHAKSCVTIAAELQDRFAVVTISDDGPGIALQRREGALQRGVRYDTRGEGAGLGLAIVADIADVWSIGLSLEDKGPGLLVRLQIPTSSNTGDKDVG